MYIVTKLYLYKTVRVFVYMLSIESFVYKMKSICLLVILLILGQNCLAWDVPAQVFLCPGAASVDVEIEMP